MHNDRRCVIIGCNIRAVYGLKDTTPMLCREHKIEETIDQTHAKCIVDGCNKYPIYEKGTWERCNQHKKYRTPIIPSLFIVNVNGKVIFAEDATKDEIINYRSKKVSRKTVDIKLNVELIDIPLTEFESALNNSL